MNWTKFLLASLIGGIVYFFLGWLVYGILLKDAFAIPANIEAIAAYPEEEFKISLMFASCLAWGVLLSLVFMRWANISTFAGGLKAGSILAALVSLFSGLGLASQYRMWSVQTTLMDVVANVVCTAIAAGVIGWFLGRDK